MKTKLLVVVGALALLALAGHPGPAIASSASVAPSVVVAVPSAAADNPIVIENRLPGSASWGLTKVGDDATSQIKGYWSSTSVKQGEAVTLFVSVNPAQEYSLDIYRLGWYGGAGGRLRLHAGPLLGTTQRACVPDATTGLTECGWTGSYQLTVPTDWTSGVYLGVLTNTDGFQNHVMLVVRDDRPAPFLYQQDIINDQVFNNYPNDHLTGKSLYAYNSYGPVTITGDTRAVKVSFDRPYADYGTAQFDWFEFIRWIERSGYDVTYSTNIDTHANGAAIRSHRAFLSVGFDQYWTKEMFDAVEAARDAGVNLAFFGAAAVESQARIEPSSTGAANRVLVAYKDVAIDPINGPTTTVKFRNPPVNRPEQSLVGVLANGLMNGVNADYVVSSSSHWIFTGTGFKDGDSVPGLVGYVTDGFMTQYPAPNSTNQRLLSNSPFVDYVGNAKYQQSSIYQAPSGAWVFDAGTLSWSSGLDNLWHVRADPRIQRTTANLLNAFLYGPPISSFGVTVPAAATAGQPFTVDVTALDSEGLPIGQYSGTVHFAASDSAAGVVVPADARLVNGRGSFSMTLITAAPQTITISDVANAVSATKNVVVNGKAASHFTLVTSASPSVGTSFSFDVTALDDFGNTDTAYAGSVQFTSSDHSSGVVLPATATLTGGRGTFSATLMQAGPQTITATDATSAAVTGSLAVSVLATAASLDITSPATATAGQSFAVTVTARLADGSIATGHQGNVHFASSDTSSRVVLPPDSALASGTGTFSVTLTKAGSQTITVTDPANLLAKTVTLTVANAPASAFVVTTSTSSPTAGVGLNLTVTAQDTFGNVALNYAGRVHFTSTDTSSGVVLPADATLASGTGTFSATLAKAGPQTITATDAASSSITGAVGLTVRAASASRLVLATTATPTAGVTFTFTVTAQDRFGNVDTAYPGRIHFTSSDTATGVVLPADATIGSGTGTFSATLTKAGSQTITGTDTATASITGNVAVVVRAASASTLTLTGPSTTAASHPVAVVVTLRDRFGNVATGYRGTVHFTTSDMLSAVPDDYTFTTTDAGTHSFSVTLWTPPSQTVTVRDTVTPTITDTRRITVTLF
jgi:hypothetical protein